MSAVTEQARYIWLKPFRCGRSRLITIDWTDPGNPAMVRFKLSYGFSLVEDVLLQTAANRDGIDSVSRDSNAKDGSNRYMVRCNPSEDMFDGFAAFVHMLDDLAVAVRAYERSRAAMKTEAARQSFSRPTSQHGVVFSSQSRLA